MKHKFQIINLALAASFLTLTARAQETTTNPQPDHAGPIREGITQTRVDRMNDTVKASDLIGMAVSNDQGEAIGKVQDLVVDVEHGRLVQVILATGTFLGKDGMMTAVAPRSLHYDADNKNLQLDAGREKLKMAPKFEPQTWNEGTQSNRVTELYVYYGENPYFISYRHNAWITNRDGTMTRTSSRNEGRNNDAGTATADAGHITVQSATNKWSYMGDIQKASDLMGMPVNNLQDENLGKVDNLLLDLPTGRIVAVVISSGGFLGMGDALSPVPPTALRFGSKGDLVKHPTSMPASPMNLQNTGDLLAHSSAASPNDGPEVESTSNLEILRLDASKEMLSKAPHFKADQWPDFGQPSYVGGIYRAYNVVPYFNTNTISKSDNAPAAK